MQLQNHTSTSINDVVADASASSISASTSSSTDVSATVSGDLHDDEKENNHINNPHQHVNINASVNTASNTLTNLPSKSTSTHHSAQQYAAAEAMFMLITNSKSSVTAITNSTSSSSVASESSTAASLPSGGVSSGVGLDGRGGGRGGQNTQSQIMSSTVDNSSPTITHSASSNMSANAREINPSSSTLTALQNNPNQEAANVLLQNRQLAQQQHQQQQVQQSNFQLNERPPLGGGSYYANRNLHLNSISNGAGAGASTHSLANTAANNATINNNTTSAPYPRMQQGIEQLMQQRDILNKIRLHDNANGNDRLNCQTSFKNNAREVVAAANQSSARNVYSTNSNVSNNIISSNNKRNDNNNNNASSSGCTCKKSKCLKLYCQCFASSVRCSEEKCVCVSCENKVGNEKKIQAAKNVILERNPRAFEDKFRRETTGSRGGNSLVHPHAMTQGPGGVARSHHPFSKQIMGPGFQNMGK